VIAGPILLCYGLAPTIGRCEKAPVMTNDRGQAPAARVRSKVWVEREGDVLLSEWRISLLEAVAETGSLAAAAAALDVPYRTAWDRVREMEQRLQRRLLERESGGADGGGSRLTDEARDLIARFHRVTAGIGGEVERRFGQEFGNDDL